MEKILKSIPDSGILAIDGRCGAGKTTLAAALSERLSCPVIHMDHFFLPRAMQTAARLTAPGGNIHHERFAADVLGSLGDAFSYTPWDCKRQAMGEPIFVSKSRYTVVEGSYSMHPVFGRYFDFGIFMDISKEEQTARLQAREGDGFARCSERWIPLEELYFTACSVRERADIVISGGDYHGI